MRKTLHRLSVTSLIAILLVMLAGSVVRMTGSGMGCPDWPKCFGYMIPPTHIDNLTWSSGRDFEKGNIIVYNEGLLVAKSDFKAGSEFELSNWKPYTKHDYAIFNPVHTWIEFINRLIGVLSGLPVLALFGFSLFYFKRDPLVPLLAFLGLILLGFEAWLGKLVVDGNLIPHSITYHLFGAIALVAIYVFLTARLAVFTEVKTNQRDRRIIIVGSVALLLMLFQIWMGTQLREEVDGLNALGISRTGWIENLSLLFEFHRSFSIVVLAIVTLYALAVYRKGNLKKWPVVLMILVAVEILAGVIMAYAHVPAAVQPVHLMFAVLSFATAWYCLLFYLKTTASLKATSHPR